MANHAKTHKDLVKVLISIDHTQCDKRPIQWVRWIYWFNNANLGRYQYKNIMLWTTFITTSKSTNKEFGCENYDRSKLKRSIGKNWWRLYSKINAKPSFKDDEGWVGKNCIGRNYRFLSSLCNGTWITKLDFGIRSYNYFTNALLKGLLRRFFDSTFNNPRRDPTI